MCYFGAAEAAELAHGEVVGPLGVELVREALDVRRALLAPAARGADDGTETRRLHLPGSIKLHAMSRAATATATAAAAALSGITSNTLPTIPKIMHQKKKKKRKHDWRAKETKPRANCRERNGFSLLPPL